MRGDHDELEIFLEIRLIPSRIDQKVKNKEGKYMLLKGKLGPILRPFAVIMGTVFRGRGGDSLDQATIMVLVIHRSPSDQVETIPRRKLLDRAAIAVRSDRDRGVLLRAFSAVGLSFR